MKLDGKVAIVTGGGSGIGRASSELFAAEGARMVVADLDLAGARETIEAAEARGGEGVAIACDVTAAEEVAALVHTAVDMFGRLDIVLNCAGRPSPVSLGDLREEEWDRTFAVNAKSVYLVSKYAAPAMSESGGGSIITIASAAALVAMAGQPAYCASKGAVVSLTKALALELCADGIRVNCICPGTVRTPMMEAYYAQRFPTPGERARMLAELEQPRVMGRIGKPNEIAAAALFLASDDASFVNGAVLPVDGGFLAFK